MSTSNVVAENKMESDRNGGPPPIDVKDIVGWVKTLKMFLMKKKQNHLGLTPHGLVAPAINASDEMKLAFERKVEEWKERKDTCISISYECASNHGEALEIADQYVLEKEILPANDANKESLASELTSRLVNRFRGELEDEIADFSSQFTNFKMIPGEKVEKGVDRFNGIVQKLNRHNRGPTVDAKKANLREALEIGNSRIGASLCGWPFQCWIILLSRLLRAARVGLHRPATLHEKR
jgi:hypothetical protein